MKSRELCAAVGGISYSRLWYLVRQGSITPPGKDASGDYVWPPESVEVLRLALERVRRRRRQGAEAAAEK
jgi:hypothetical protein